jgi:2-polyprenyl-3-methyl-5-hydroxy-6-metoxy-1,4-benzoquinol methylase
MLRDVLAKPSIYSLFARFIGATRGRRLYIQRYVRPRAGDRILDIGCGPADILEALPQVDYHGFDLSAEYIESARKRFGARGHFNVEAVNLELLKKYVGFDLVLATGVLHHLSDTEAVDLFHVAKTALRANGRLITLDGCFLEGQSPLARQLLKRDRGRYVRNETGYAALARNVFNNVQPFLTTELLRIPYTHIILECRP